MPFARLEWGVPAREGAGVFRAELPRVLADEENGLARRMRRLWADLIPRYQRRFPSFDEVVSRCARGMSRREIQGHPRELYGIEVRHNAVQWRIRVPALRTAA